MLTRSWGVFCLFHQIVAGDLERDLVYGFAGIVDEICTFIAFLVYCGWSDLSIVCVKEGEDERCLFVDMACDRVHDDCEPFSVVGGEQEVGHFLLELVDVFEVGDTCDVLSFIHVDFLLGHAVISRGVSRMDWVDVGSFRSNKIVS